MRIANQPSPVEQPQDVPPYLDSRYWDGKFFNQDTDPHFDFLPSDKEIAQTLQALNPCVASLEQPPIAKIGGIDRDYIKLSELQPNTLVLMGLQRLSVPNTAAPYVRPQVSDSPIEIPVGLPAASISVTKQVPLVGRDDQPSGEQTSVIFQSLPMIGTVTRINDTCSTVLGAPVDRLRNVHPRMARYCLEPLPLHNGGMQTGTTRHIHSAKYGGQHRLERIPYLEIYEPVQPNNAQTAFEAIRQELAELALR